MNFSFTLGIASAPTLCTRENFEQLVSSPSVKDNIYSFRHGDKLAKKRLPAFCFHACFKDNKRLSANAIPSTLVMIDIDHLTDDELWKLVAKAMPEHTPEAQARTEVMLIHITPSGRGLRIVIKATHGPGYEMCSSISDYQQVFARKIGASFKLDPVATDYARLSFCPSKDDILYLNERLWTDEPEISGFGTPFYGKQDLAQPALQPVRPEPRDELKHQQMYRGIPLDIIFKSYFEQTGGLPQEGDRNTRFYEAARALRYICDFKPSVIAAHLPDVGLSGPEVMSVCTSACQSTRSSQMPAPLQQIIACLSTSVVEESNAAAEATPPESPISPDQLQEVLPPLFRRFTKLYPPSFTEAITLAMLPIVGCLSTRLRAPYFVDGEMHSPSFMTMITAEQASGKSFTRRLVKTLLATIYEEDRENLRIEKEYRTQVRQSKNSKKQPDKPDILVRIIPPTVSIAKLLERLDQAGGLHAFSFAEELDTVIKSNSAGAWSLKTDLYRNAFDNSEYGQDYMSDNTYSVTLPVFYNLLFCGTPRQTYRFFNDVENGLVSRFCFATLPDQFGAEIPTYGELNENDLGYINACVAKLRQSEGVVAMDFLKEPLSAWLEEHRLQALMDNDRAHDIFRRRAAVIGFRAALAVSPLYKHNGQNHQKLTDFALAVASLVLKRQMDFAGAKLNAVFEPEKSGGKPILHRSIFEALPEEFHADDLFLELQKRGRKTPIKNMIYRWKKSGLIDDGDTAHVYIKLKK